MRAEFNDRLKEALRIKNMKSIELAYKLNVNRAIISQYLNGRYKPNQNRLFEISKILQVSPVWLMGFNVPMEDITTEMIDEKQFSSDVVDALKDMILSKLEDVNDIDKKAEILDDLGFTLTKLSKEMRGK